MEPSDYQPNNLADISILVNQANRILKEKGLNYFLCHKDFDLANLADYKPVSIFKTDDVKSFEDYLARFQDEATVAFKNDDYLYVAFGFNPDASPVCSHMLWYTRDPSLVTAYLKTIPVFHGTLEQNP